MLETSDDAEMMPRNRRSDAARAVARVALLGATSPTCRSWWRGRVVAVMNAQWIGAWDVAPKSHPNDGLLDVFDADLSLDDRLKVRSRLRTGTHVPHPGIAQSRVAALQVEFDRPTPIWLDGEQVGRARALAIRIEPDAITCVV